MGGVKARISVLSSTRTLLKVPCTMRFPHKYLVTAIVSASHKAHGTGKPTLAPAREHPRHPCLISCATHVPAQPPGSTRHHVFECVSVRTPECTSTLSVRVHESDWQAAHTCEDLSLLPPLLPPPPPLEPPPPLLPPPPPPPVLCFLLLPTVPREIRRLGVGAVRRDDRCEGTGQGGRLGLAE